MNQSDDDIQARVAAGDPEAFAGLVEQHSGLLFRYLLRMVGNVAEAEDLLQETFVAAFTARERYEERGSLRAWLLTIACNRARNALRDEARTLVDTERVEAELACVPCLAGQPEEETLRLELRAAILAALQSLLPARREAVVLRDVEGCSYAEVAAVLGVSQGAARVLVHRGREQLRGLLGPYLAEGEGGSR